MRQIPQLMHLLSSSTTYGNPDRLSSSPMLNAPFGHDATQYWQLLHHSVFKFSFFSFVTSYPPLLLQSHILIVVLNQFYKHSHAVTIRCGYSIFFSKFAHRTVYRVYLSLFLRNNILRSGRHMRKVNR